MRYRLLVFDFDGTLADSFAFFLDTIDTLADAHGFRKIDRSQLDSLRQLDARQILKHVGLPLWKAARVGAHYKRLMAEQASRIPLFAGIAPMLRALQARGASLAMLSSNSEQNVRTVLGPELAPLFAHYQCGSALFGKRDKLRRLLAQTGISRHQVLCIGDEVRDIEAAQAENLDFGAVAWGYTRPQALLARAPVFLFEHPEQILRALEAR
jgi:phosphoglycolate phosphatase